MRRWKNNMLIDLKLLNPSAKAPIFATSGSAGVDIYAHIEKEIAIHPGNTALIPTGFAMAIPPGFAALLIPRSGLGHKSGIVLGNLVGLIDEDYRGGVAVSVWNRQRSGMPFLISPGDRIAQMVIVPIARPTYRVVEELPSTDRGDGGFGSTGV
jgi:dUTP pyrophosphatase